jgi:hypothetical protein
MIHGIGQRPARRAEVMVRIRVGKEQPIALRGRRPQRNNSCRISPVRSVD